MSAIKAGDLVIVAQGHDCTLNAFGGVPFVMGPVQLGRPGVWTCRRCNNKNVGTFSRFVRFRGAHIPLEYLQKIDPTAQPETITLDEEVTA